MPPRLYEILSAYSSLAILRAYGNMGVHACSISMASHATVVYGCFHQHSSAPASCPASRYSAALYIIYWAFDK